MTLIAFWKSAFPLIITLEPMHAIILLAYKESIFRSKTKAYYFTHHIKYL